MAVEYYEGTHTCKEIDQAVEMVLSGDIIKNNTSNTVAEEEKLPVSGDAVSRAIEANGDALNAKIIDLHEAVDGKVDKAENARLITEEEVEKFNDKAEKGGVYPNFVSGWSRNLTGRGDATKRMFVYAPTAGDLSIGDGVARIKSIKGNTIIWNQQNPDPKLNSNALVITGKDMGVVNGFRRLESEDGSATLLQIRVSRSPYAVKEHIYLVTFRAKTDSSSIIFYTNGAFSKDLAIAVSAGTIVYGEYITTGRAANYIIPSIKAQNATYLEATDLQIYDLTQMFGAGNEPSTVEEFKALFPNGNYENNTGEIRSLNVSHIKTTGFNQWDEKWELGVYSDSLGTKQPSTHTICNVNRIQVFPNTGYYIKHPKATNLLAYIYFYDFDGNYLYREAVNSRVFTTPSNCQYINFFMTTPYGNVYKNDICINISHTGYRNGEYEPYEEHTLRLGELSKYMPLRAIPGVYDEINANEVIKRIGVVKLKDLTWTSPNSDLLGKSIFNAKISDMRPRGESEDETTYRKSILCSKYSIATNTSYDTMNDKSIFRQGSAYGIVIRDTTYTTIADFIASLTDDDVVYYELTEPNEEVFAEAFNLNYLVSDFGTEEAIVAEDSAPFRADVIYQFNAQDRIRKNSEVIATIDSKYLAATPSGNPNHNLYISLGATWTGSTWLLNGVELTNEEIDVSYLCSVPYLHRMQENAWNNMPTYFANHFKTNFSSLLGVAYNSSAKALNANGIGYAASKLQVVRFQNFRSETSYKVFLNNPTYMFGSNANLREIQDYLDVSLCTSFTQSFGARATSLETVWLIGLKASINFAGTPVLKKECLLYMIQKAAPTSAITITVHADVYAWASTDTDIQNALTAQQSLITLIS